MYENSKKLFSAAKDGGKNIVKNGKFMYKGVSNSFAKGAKSLDDLGKRLGQRLKFKKFKNVIKKFRFSLFGEVNPWVLLASGEIKHVSQKDIKKLDGKGPAQVGDAVEDLAGQKGIVVGSHSSKSGRGASTYVEELTDLQKAGHVDELTDIYKNLDQKPKLGPGSRKAEIHGGNTFDYDQAVKDYGQQSADAIKNRGKLANSIGKAPSKLHEAHHLLPVELIGRNEFLRKAVDAGFDFNGSLNGKWIKRFSSRVEDMKDGLHASHPRYTDGVHELINKHFKKFDINTMKPEEIVKEMDSIAVKVGRLVDNNLNSDIPIKLNELFD